MSPKINILAYSILVVLASMQIGYTTLFLSILVGFQALSFYTVTLFLFITVYEIDRDSFYDVDFVWMTLFEGLSRLVAVYTVYVMTPYEFLFWLTVPYVMIRMLYGIFGVLVCYEILEIEDKK